MELSRRKGKEIAKAKYFWCWKIPQKGTEIKEKMGHQRKIGVKGEKKREIGKTPVDPMVQAGNIFFKPKRKAKRN